MGPTPKPTAWRLAEDSFGRYASHPNLGLRLRHVEAGIRLFGQSESDRRAILELTSHPNLSFDELLPASGVAIGPFWAAELPISVMIASSLGVEPGRSLGEHHPAMLTIDEATEVAERLGGRLPSEREWETVCRGGTTGLFPWGDDLPADDELERWLSWDLGGMATARNPMGFGGLFFGEWTADVFQTPVSQTTSVSVGDRVIKGGGAQFWPWQDDEWVWCMAAMRMPSSDLFTDRRAAVRVVVDALGET